MVKYEWDLVKFLDGRKFFVYLLIEKSDGKIWEYVMKERFNLIGQLSNIDEKIVDEVLLVDSIDKIKIEFVRKVFRNVIMKR